MVIHLEERGADNNNNNNTDTDTKVIPEEDYHKSRVTQVNFSCWFLTALAALFLGLRIYCKRYRVRGLWWDDHVLIISWISLATSTSFIHYSTTLGFGLPTSLFNPSQSAPVLNHYLLITNLAGTFSILAALWSKTSFAITVLRISQDSWVRLLIRLIILSINLSLGVAVALTWGQCDPIPKIWQPDLPGHCMAKQIQIHYNMFTAVYSGAMDIVLAVLPWHIIWSLTLSMQINRHEKLGVLVAMSMGVFAGVISIVKATELPAIGNSNFTFASTNLVILGIAESAITIMAASIPILRALLREYRGPRPPPPPAEFIFYNLGSLENPCRHDNDMYAGAGPEGTQGTGRSSTTVTSKRRSGRSKRRGLFGSLNLNLTRESNGSTGRSKRRGLFGSLNLNLTRESMVSTGRSPSEGGTKDEEAGMGSTGRSPSEGGTKDGHGHVAVHVHHLHPAADSGGHGGHDKNGKPVTIKRLSTLGSALSVAVANTEGVSGRESDMTAHLQQSVSGHDKNGKPVIIKRLSTLGCALSVASAEGGSGRESVSGQTHGHRGVVHVPGKNVKEREVTIAYDQTRSSTPDTQGQRMTEWPLYPSQGSDNDLAHVPAMKPWGDGDDDDDGRTKESMGRR
ncbi:hypothetical protein QBC45DRAFT_392316 [Copromyces sp. CBS 386.78]|nr:hypothetical protein QBC45DRAFT_392316 [Copromyces sp. CBS 386.78]